MTLTEVVFEIADAVWPLARATASHRDVDVVLRAWRETSTGAHGLATLTGSTRATSLALAHAAPEREAPATFVPVADRDGACDIVVRAPVNGAHATRDAFGDAAVCKPVRVRRGVTRWRALVPGTVDARDATRRLERSAGPDLETRVLRVATWDAAFYANVARRVLSLEEEHVLALAWGLGYYAKPKGCRLDDIAARVGLSPSPVHKRLKSIEHALVSRHVDPTSVTLTRARAARRARVRPIPDPPEPAPDARALHDVRLRVTLPDVPLVAAAAQEPAVHVMAVPHDAPGRDGERRHLVVVTGGKAARAHAITALADAPHAVHAVAVAESTAASVLLVTAHADAAHAPWADDPVPFDRAAALFGGDAHVHDAHVEGSAVWIRCITNGAPPATPPRPDLEALMTTAGATEVELISARPLIALPQGKGLAPLTPRQEETLRIAHAFGYYHTPRGCTLQEVAEALGVSTNAVHKNLVAAEHKLVSNHFAVVD